MEVRHDLLHPWPADKPIRVARRDPGDEPDAGIAGRLSVVRGVAGKEGFLRGRAGLVEDLPDAPGLRLWRAVDLDEVLREIPPVGDLLHLALRGRGDDVERSRREQSLRGSPRRGHRGR